MYFTIEFKIEHYHTCVVLLLLPNEVTNFYMCFFKSPDMHATTENLSTVAVIPISDDVPLDRSCLELTHALSGIGEYTKITQDFIRCHKVHLKLVRIKIQ